MNSTKFNENFEIENIKFSKKDKSRRIVIPNILNEDLSEIIGILLGDGHLGIYADKNRNNKICRFELNLSGNLTEDIQYYNYVNQIFKSLFGVSLNIKKWEARNALVITIGSKAILTFFKNIGFPINNKNNNAVIPEIILNASFSEKSTFLRGLADTDFSLTFKKRKKTLHSYPVIKAIFKSKTLVDDLRRLLSNLKLHFTYCKETSYDNRMNKWFIQHAIYIRGHKNLKNWMRLIGFKNPKHFTKYLIWKEFGFCPPYTRLSERYKILSMEINPYNYYE